MDLQTATNDVMRKVGRNLLLFQQLENALKFLVMNGQISGYISDIQSNTLKRSEAVRKQTLGMVAGQFFEQNFSNNEGDEQLPEQLKEPHLKVKIQFDVENGNPEGKEELLSNLVSGRNDLVHHFLKRIEPESLDSWLEASDYLDVQRKEIIPELDYYTSHAASVKELRRGMSEFLNSEEGRKQFLS